ncbi:hypothetical protein DFJ74DRAFT_730629 [Hyaloraphidium curvatum]|nr:hypothetical protein DFJ74DRAFT_730629 [Hyaloraphidium curvatum]
MAHLRLHGAASARFHPRQAALLAAALLLAVLRTTGPAAAASMPWRAAPVWCASAAPNRPQLTRLRLSCRGCTYPTADGCCCPRLAPATVTKTVTAIRFARPLAAAAIAGRGFTPREPDDAAPQVGHALAPRHLCPACPRGVAILRTSDTPSGSRWCCPPRRTLTRTITRTRRASTPKRRTTPRRTATARIPLRFTLSVRLVDPSGIPWPGVDLVAGAPPARRLAARDCPPNPLFAMRTGTDGSAAGNTTTPPPPELLLAVLDGCIEVGRIAWPAGATSVDGGTFIQGTTSVTGAAITTLPWTSSATASSSLTATTSGTASTSSLSATTSEAQTSSTETLPSSTLSSTSFTPATSTISATSSTTSQSATSSTTSETRTSSTTSESLTSSTTSETITSLTTSESLTSSTTSASATTSQTRTTTSLSQTSSITSESLTSSTTSQSLTSSSTSETLASSTTSESLTSSTASETPSLTPTRTQTRTATRAYVRRGNFSPGCTTPDYDASQVDDAANFDNSAVAMTLWCRGLCDALPCLQFFIEFGRGPATCFMRTQPGDMKFSCGNDGAVYPGGLWFAVE